MIKDLAIDHSYYCSEYNYYDNDTRFHQPTWDDFMSKMGDADMDFNLIFRWDIMLNEDTNEYYMELFYMQQRHGKFIVWVIDNVTDEDEESIKEFLSKYWQYMTELWKPISK